MTKDEERSDVLAKEATDKENKSIALETAMKMGTQCSRTTKRIVEDSEKLYKFLSERGSNGT